MLRLAVINGANLNMLGRREPEIYGNTSFEEYLGHLQERYASTVVFDYYQSNIEGELVDYIQKAGTDSDGIIVNAGYSHTSVVIADAIKTTKVPCVEVHISNVFRREEIRRSSLISAYAEGVVIGLGLDGYRLAVEWFLQREQ